jgi:hypothetical protein
MVWGLIVGAVLIAVSIWLYSRGRKRYGAIGIALGIAVVLLGYWSGQVIEDEGDPDVPAPADEVATPEVDEGGV